MLLSDESVLLGLQSVADFRWLWAWCRLRASLCTFYGEQNDGHQDAEARIILEVLGGAYHACSARCSH